MSDNVDFPRINPQFVNIDRMCSLVLKAHKLLLFLTAVWQLLSCPCTASYVVAITHKYPDSEVHGVNMGPIWSQQDPGGPNVRPMNPAIWVAIWPGPRRNIKTVFAGVGISIIKIRRLWDRLIFKIGIPILLIRYLYIETDPWTALSSFARWWRWGWPLHPSLLDKMTMTLVQFPQWKPVFFLFCFSFTSDPCGVSNDK